MDDRQNWYDDNSKNNKYFHIFAELFFIFNSLQHIKICPLSSFKSKPFQNPSLKLFSEG